MTEAALTPPDSAGAGSPPALDRSLPDLSVLHEAYCLPTLRTRKFTHQELWTLLEALTEESPDIQLAEIGRSARGRALRSLTFGTGPVRVLLWSQMHGDEPTHTMGLADLFAYWRREPEDPRVAKLRDGLTVVAVPMLNPDGAERFQRLNGQGIDPNQDARAWATPEMRALRDLFHRVRPHFSFGLHDQSVRKRVGRSDRLTALALLACPFDEARQDNDARRDAKRVCGVIRGAVEPMVGGRVARFEEEYDPKGMGEYAISQGSSSILLEAGFWPDDPEKQFLRRVSFVAILSALETIADGSYAGIPTDAYETLEENDEEVHDLLLRGGRVVVPGLEPYRADVGIDFDSPLDLDGGRVVAVGDLSGTAARETLDASELYVHAEPEALHDAGRGEPALSDGMPACFTLREGPGPDSRAVFRVRDGVVSGS